jgi:hypothetical protein
MLAIDIEPQQEPPFLATMRDVDTTILNSWTWQTHRFPPKDFSNRNMTQDKGKSLRSKKEACFLALRPF